MEGLEPPLFSGDSFHKEDTRASLEFASFWQRAAAVIIDSFILIVLSGVVYLLCSLILGASIDPGQFIRAMMWGDANSMAMAAKGPALDLILFSSLASFVMYWLYNAGFESSIRQATPGKSLLRIIVTDLAGNRISFGTATGRCLGKLLSAAIFFIGFLMAAFTNHKQALHDRIAGTIVVRNPNIIERF